MSEIKRRTFLKLSTGAAVAATGGIGFAALNSKDSEKNGSTFGVEPFFGSYQSGIATKQQEHATWVSYQMKPEANSDALGRLMRVWTTDAARLMSGRESLADNESTLAIGSSNLTITFGFGPNLLAMLGHDLISDLPSFSTDKLQPQWSGGDLLIQVCGNDQVKVHHAVRELTLDAKPFADLLWRQTGFLPSVDISNNQTPRNLMGQKDGTANYAADSHEFADTVWQKSGPATAGTTMVIRRIQMNLDKWETLSPDLKSKSIGRDIQSGAPLSGGDEFTPADFSKTDHHGLVIPGDAHMRRARHDTYRLHRRGYNYQTESAQDNSVDHGLVFVSYQADLEQFIQIQNRISTLDTLNTWTTAIGSAVFLIPPGCEDGGWIGETLI